MIRSTRLEVSEASLLVEFLELTTNEPLSDLLGATADVVQLGIAPVPATGVLIDVAIASKQLDALVGHSNGSARIMQVNGS